MQNALKNSASGMTNRLLIIVCNFITRTVLIYTLSTDYIGLNGLFLNIIKIFSLTELGIGVSIAFCLYKPVSEGDNYTTNAFMSLFARLYRTIALIIMSIGVLAMPFIHLLINNNPFEKSYLRLVLLLFIVESASSYLLSYRSIILSVCEKSYIINTVQTVVIFVIFVFQVILLLKTRNYIIYKSVDIVVHLAQNIVLFYISKKKYPQIKISREYSLSTEDKSALINRVKGASLGRISHVATNFTDTLFISFFFGVTAAGLFSNYNLIITMSVYAIIRRMLDGASAAFGNLIARGSDVKRNFFRFFFIGFWISSFSFVSLLTLLNPFVRLWIGSQNLLPFSNVLVMSVNFYVLSLGYIVTVLRESSGVFAYDKKVSVLKPVLNLVASYIAIQFLGLIGVFVGTLISLVVCDIILYPRYLYKYLFKERPINYFKRYAVYLCVTVLSAAICGLLCSVLRGVFSQVIAFLFSCAICVIIPNLIIVFLFRKSEEMQFLRTHLFHLLKVKRSDTTS